MKLLKCINVCFLLFVSVLITSCEDKAVDLPDNNGYYVKVTIDGVEKKWSTVQAENSTALDAFVLSAGEPSSTISLILFNVSNAGVYNLQYGEKSCVYTEGTTTFSSTYTDLTSSAGNITITELNKTDKTIKGTFNFTGKNQTNTATKVFTKGEFFLKYVIK